MPQGEKIAAISKHAQKIRQEGEKWQDAVRRATVELKEIELRKKSKKVAVT